ncbi:MAG TPA: response regulator, partial [Burkholderiaceae bacterium]|nr:response regulator [Burkholderiaceae bacterium]
GLGLGLALAKTLIELHGGSVEAHSDGPGRGATFSFRLPRVPPASVVPSRTPLPAQAQRMSRLRLLIVDDNRDAASSLAQLMRIHGHRVETAFDGPSALQLAREQHFDAFVLDIGLPGFDGHELARRIRELPGSGNAIFVALTGYGQPADRERSSAAGFDHHLVKPIEPELLERLLAESAQRRLPNPQPAA